MAPSSRTLVNGREADSIPTSDRGLLYGDGVFETIAVTKGQPVSLNRHLKRLNLGCHTLGMACPDSNELRNEISLICDGLRRAVLKIVVTRGQGSRGYRPDPSIHPTRIVTVYPWQEYPAHYYERGVIVTVCKTRLSSNNLLAGIKHLNRLEQVMARREWRDEYQEGLMLGEEGDVIEGTMSNLFLIRGNELFTPELSRAGVAGIMRERIMECAQHFGLPVNVTSLTLSHLQQADSVFLSNSLIKIWPVRKINSVEYKRHPLIREFLSRIDSFEY